jgi:hypothetical protein
MGRGGSSPTGRPLARLGRVRLRTRGPTLSASPSTSKKWSLVRRRISGDFHGPNPGPAPGPNALLMRVNRINAPHTQLFRFREADRFLYAWVMFGRDPSTGVRTKAEAVLSTLEVDQPE